MSYPANFIAAIATNEFKFGRWLEIEGLPFAVGSFSADASFFSGRAAALQLKGIGHSLKAVPRTLDQTLEVLEGGAQTVGQVEFEIVDVAALNLAAIGTITGAPVQWAGQGYTTGQVHLSADITAAVTTIPFLGSGASFTNGGYCFIGTEAIKIGTVGASSFTGCTRGQFRSKAQAFGVGMQVSLRPTVMANRRCWFYHNACLITETLTGAGSAVANQLLRFSGIVRNLRLKDGEWGSFVVPAQTVDQELNRDCFRSFRSDKMRGTSIMDKDGKNGFVTVPGFPGYSATRGSEVWNLRSSLWTVGEYTVVKIDDEYFMAQITAGVSPTVSLKLLTRGLFGSLVEAHKDGAIVQEVIPVGAYGTTNNFFSACKFSSVATAGSPLNADHPLLILLQLMLSTGEGTNTAGGGTRNYDVLPSTYGMGVTYDRIDIAGIEAAAAEEPQLRWGGVMTKPMNFVALMRQMLSFAGYYFFSDAQDQLRIRRCRPPYPDAVTRTIQNNNRIRTHKTGWDGNYSGAVRDIEFKHDFNIATQQYERITRFITAADIYAKGLARQMKYESNLVYTGFSDSPGAPPLGAFDIDQWLLTRRDFYRLRYGKPPAIVTERCDISFIDVTIGDLLAVTHGDLPSSTTGARGMVDELGEVINKSIDDATNTVVLRILMTGYQLGSYRFISPSLEVATSTTHDNSIFAGTYVANSFTDATGPKGAAQNDGLVEAGNGNTEVTFNVGENVRIWNKDFSEYLDGSLSSFNTGTRAFSISIFGNSSLGHNGSTFLAAAVGFFITFEDYANSAEGTYPQSNKTPHQLYGYAAEVDDSLTGEQPHIYFPT